MHAHNNFYSSTFQKQINKCNLITANIAILTKYIKTQETTITNIVVDHLQCRNNSTYLEQGCLTVIQEMT